MKSIKTVWCISKYASPPNYGFGSRLFYIAREFTKLGLDTILISSDSNHLSTYPKSKDTYNHEFYANLEHVWIKTYKYKKSASLKRIISWIDFEIKLFNYNKLRKKPPDIVIVSSLSILTIIFGVFLKKKYNCKLIFEIRDIYPLTLTEEFGVSEWNPIVLLMGMIEKFGYKKSDLIVGTMPNLRKRVIEIIGENKDVFYSPLGINEVWNSEQKESSTVDSLFPCTDRFIIGYAGSMSATNALGSLLKVIQNHESELDCYFVLVGEGDLKKSYVDLLSGLDNVKVGPKIQQNEVRYFLSKCDLLYFSTHKSRVWEYGQSLNKLIDYMMSGRPIIASYSGYPSMINEANCGMFIPTENVDRIVEAIKYFRDMHPKDRETFGLRGRTWIESNHKYENIAKNYYNKIMGLYL